MGTGAIKTKKNLSHHMNILFLIEGWISPAPRYRVLQYIDYLEKAGLHCTVRALHGHRYPVYSRWPGIGQAYKLFVRAKRLAQIRDADQFDAVFLQRMTLPFSSLIEKRLVRHNPHLIFDYDDAIFQTEQGEAPSRKKAFNQICQMAASIVAGSAYLARFATKEAEVIPTPIDTARYRPTAKPNASPLVLGWMGTHSNYPNFQAILPSLEALLKRNKDLVFKVVSDVPPPFSLPKMSFKRWSADDEIADLQSFHIGIMPLEDTTWNRGKCAFKLIQYMAVGIPTLAGPTGANLEVTVPGKTGYLPTTPQAWTEGIQSLVENPELRQALGTQGRLRCEQNYSVSSQAPRLLAVLQRTAKKSL